MYRCLELAALGSGNVAPNPMVGAILVHHDRIIGEGYHKKYGESHAEPNCIASVRDEDRPLIKDSVLYISLEPCVHFGKTPPCTDLIIKNKISKVVIGCRDPFHEVNGKGIERLQNAGIAVVQGVLENECKKSNRRFLTFHTQHRPYIILKWAQTANRKMAEPTKDRLLITNEITNRVVHKWRSEESAILIGTNTAMLDNPRLTTRLWTGNNPIRLVVDMHLKLPLSLHVFNEEAKTVIFNTLVNEERKNILFYQVREDFSLVHHLRNALYQLNIQSVIVEGGAKLLQSFIDEESWDEARVITNEELVIEDGLASPDLASYSKTGEERILSDKIEIFRSNSNIYF